MAYYKFQPDIYSDYDITGGPVLPSGLRFKSGAPLPGDRLPKPLEFEVNHPSGVSLEHLLGAAIPVASATLLSALEQAGVDNFQRFPAILVNPATGQEWQGYYAVNVLGLLDVVNMSASEYVEVMGGSDGMPPLVGFQKIVIDGTAAIPFRMFRLLQEPSVLVVSDEVIQVLQASKPPEGWGITATKLEET